MTSPLLTVAPMCAPIRSLRFNSHHETMNESVLAVHEQVTNLIVLLSAPAFVTDR
jgi:hypothetical protein